MTKKKVLATAAILFAFFSTGQTITVETKCITSSVNGKGEANKTCQFPFKLQGKTYYSCTYDFSHVSDYKPWCSTKVDEDFNHVSGGGHWGVCDDDVNCPIPPRYCGVPLKQRPNVTDSDFNIKIEQQPWVVSLGTWKSVNFWEHHCVGSLVTGKQILTAGHCFDYNRTKRVSETDTVRLGVTDLSLPLSYGVERRISEVLIHPKYLTNEPYFDVAIVVVKKDIEFTQTIGPICLPMRPVDDVNYLKKDFVTLAGWSSYYDTREKKFDNSTLLKLVNQEILETSVCEKKFSESAQKERGRPSFLIKNGFTKQISCVEYKFISDNNARCLTDAGAPVVKLLDGTARGDNYYEQHLLASQGHCDFPLSVYVRLTERSILTWIQKVTETQPLLMVVGGFNNKYTDNGYLDDVELVSSIPNNFCSTFVRPLPGNLYEYDDGFAVGEGEIVGLTGQYTKNTAIVCGGKNFEQHLRTCFEFNSENNKWFEIDNLNFPRWEAASVIGRDDNLWIIGGTNGTFGSKSTEIYDYKPDGQGTWTRGVDLPQELGDAGISSHCAVRLNSTHVFLGGGFANGFELSSLFAKLPKRNGQDPAGSATYRKCAESTDYKSTLTEDETDFKLDNEPDDEPPSDTLRIESTLPDDDNKPSSDKVEIIDKSFNVNGKLGGGIQLNLAWIYDGKKWNRISNMLEARDRPSCGLVEQKDGTIGILVAGGCFGWCQECPGVRSAEMYDPRTNKWKRVADLPVPLNSAKMETFDGLPTIVGGYDTTLKQQNGIMYQYHVDKDKWVQHSIELRIPRSSPAVFQVPRSLFRYC